MKGRNHEQNRRNHHCTQRGNGGDAPDPKGSRPSQERRRQDNRIPRGENAQGGRNAFASLEFEKDRERMANRRRRARERRRLRAEIRAANPRRQGAFGGVGKQG